MNCHHLHDSCKAYMAICIIAVLLACQEKINPPEEPPLENYPPTAPSNLLPPNDASGVTEDFVLAWESSDPDGDWLTYDVYFGLDDIPVFYGARVSQNYYRSPWPRQSRAKELLIQIYQQQDSYRNQHGAYCLNGVTTYAGDSSFAILGIFPDTSDSYSYVMAAAANTFTCTATANIDFDAAIDAWFINQTGSLTSSANDLDQPSLDTLFLPLSVYYWQVIAYDDHGHETPGPIWYFTSADTSGL